MFNLLHLYKELNGLQDLVELHELKIAGKYRIGSPTGDTGRVLLHGLSDSSGVESKRSITPVEEKEPLMPAITPEKGGPPPPGSDGDPISGIMSNIAATQKGVFEMGTVITQPGLKRAESSELLHLSLHQCARDGNPEDMQRLLSSNQYQHGNLKKRVNSKDDEGLSALHYAARYNHVPIVKLLVENMADPNDVDEEGATPLHFAARYKRVRFRGSEENLFTNSEGAATIDSTIDNSVVLYLVAKGANINARDIYGCTPLHFASMRGNELVAWELLTGKGINIEAVDKQQMTALHMGASHNEVEICRMLIEKGAELRCVDEDYATPLHYAAMEGSEKVAKMLFEAAEKKVGWVSVRSMVSDQDSQNNTSLHLAVENRSFAVANLCLEKGADVNKTNDQFSTPLHLAAVTGDIKMIDLLLDNKARVDALDYSQSTPLHKAAAHNHSAVVEDLISRGARIDKHDKDNFTPLLLAACNGHSETIATLLNKGASLWDVDKNDKTALYWAAEEDNTEACSVLLKKIKEEEADDLIDKGDRYDYTPLHIASEKGYIKCVKILLEASADSDAKNEEERTPLHLAAINGKTSVVKALVRHDITSINDEDEDSNTSLHLAALAGHNKVVTTLLEAGADIEARNCTLWTPLDCAAAKGWAKTVNILLENDAPVDPMDKSKTTPLHLASARGHVQCVNILIQNHANVTLRTADQDNCLDLAIDNGHKDVAIAIINSERWKDALRSESKRKKDGTRNTPSRKLIRKMPEVAELVFDRCTTSNTNNAEDPNYRIEFNYEFLDDMYADWVEKDASDALSQAGSIYDDDNRLVDSAKPYTSDPNVLKSNHPLMLMVEGGQEDLLAHPLVTTLLKHKWNSFGRWMYYTNLVLYCIYICFLTGYIVTTKAPYLYFDASLPNCTADSCVNIRDNCTVGTSSSSLSQTLFAEIGKYVIMALAAFNLIRELIQIVNAKLNYLGWENLLEWITYVSSLLLVIDFSKCQEETGIREVWQWQLASVAILLGWMELVLFIRKFPRFGIYVVMFTDIFKTFLWFSPVFLLFVIAFSLSFFVLFANQLRFSRPEYSLISTGVMMIGEMEFTDLFFGTEGETDATALHEQKVYYQGIAYSVFVLFIVLLTILIMNLLIGLAVDDIKSVQEQAVLKRLAMQVELALNVESILPQFIRRKFVVKCHIMEPNKKSNNILNRIMNVESGLLSSQAIIKALNPELDDIEQVMENQDKMKQQITQLRQRMKGMYQQNLKLESMIMQMMKAQNIEYNEEDTNEEDMNLINLTG